MEERNETQGRSFSCVGSDGTTHVLVAVVVDGEESLTLSDGSRAVRLCKGAYKACGRSLYLWCNHPDAP